MPVHKGRDCVGEEMSRFKKGELHSGKNGKVVTSPQQAKAIALSACGESKYAEMLQSMGYSEETAKEVAALFAESFVKSSKKSSSSGAM
jgi:organic hydroperoxide reductase OsmC/OhrA